MRGTRHRVCKTVTLIVPTFNFPVMGSGRCRVRWMLPTLHYLGARWRHFLLLILVALILSTFLHFYPIGWEDSQDRIRAQRRLVPSGCNCTRPYLWPTNHSLPPLNSTCSDPRTFYQPNQNVISFSLHLPPERRAYFERMYVEGLELNAKAALKLYPNFTLRVYTDLQLTSENPFCPVLCNNSHVFWCDVWEIPASRLVTLKLLNPTRMMVWRALALGDPTVDTFLSRDLDSVLSPREVAAVSEWLYFRPPQGIHVMRDHTDHGARIMGGLWGARNRWLANAKQLQTDIILASDALDRRSWFTSSSLNDQDVFEQAISPAITLAHDSYYCVSKNWWQAVWRPFPTQRQATEVKGEFTDFVGYQALKKKPAYKFSPCPVPCRPIYGQHWEYC